MTESITNTNIYHMPWKNMENIVLLLVGTAKKCPFSKTNLAVDNFPLPCIIVVIKEKRICTNVQQKQVWF
jgi:hypothetical protein